MIFSTQDKLRTLIKNSQETKSGTILLLNSFEIFDLLKKDKCFEQVFQTILILVNQDRQLLVEAKEALLEYLNSSYLFHPLNQYL